MKRIWIIAMIIVIIGANFSACAFVREESIPEENIITKAEMTEDILVVKDKIINYHPRFTEGEYSADETEETINEMIEGLPDEMDKQVFRFYIMELIAMTDDPHSLLFPNIYGAESDLDINTRFCNGTIYIEEAMEGNPYFDAGDEIISIGGYEYDELYALLDKVCSNSSEVGVFWYSEHLLKDKYFYEYIGVSNRWDIVKFRIKTPEGRVKNIYVNLNKLIRNNDQWNDEQAEYTCEFYEEDSVAYVDIRASRFEKDFKVFMTDFYIRAKEEGYEKIVIDMSNNPGGVVRYIDYIMMGMDIDEYTHYSGLPKKNLYKSDDLISGADFYLLVSPRTYSAGIIATATIQYNDAAVVVGTPPGDKTKFFVIRGNDTLQVFLEHTKIYFNISSQRFNINFPDYGDDITPDVYIDYTQEDIANGVNSMLEYVKNASLVK